MKLKHFFDARTSTLTYVVYDENSRSALCIDPVLDFDPASGKIWHESLEILESFLNQNKLRLEAILETHAHADHLSGALKQAGIVAVSDEDAGTIEKFVKDKSINYGIIKASLSKNDRQD